MTHWSGILQCKAFTVYARLSMFKAPPALGFRQVPAGAELRSHAISHRRARVIFVTKQINFFRLRHASASGKRTPPR